MLLGTALAALGGLPGIDVLLGWAAWLASNLLLAVVEGCARLPGAVMAVGRPPIWLPLVWYAALGCWAAARSADLRSLGLRPAVLRAGLLTGALGLAALLMAGFAVTGRTDAVEVALLDVEPSAAFVRTPSGRTALVSTGGEGRGLAASVAGRVDLWEGAVDLVIGPAGARTGVELGDLGSVTPGIAETGAAGSTEHALTEPDAGDELEGADQIDGLAAPVPEPGLRVELGDGVDLVLVDVRQAGPRSVLDLAILARGVSILLPGPGAPSARWAEFAPDGVAVARLPGGATAWARAQPARRWLLLVGDSPPERWRGDSTAPLLMPREHGLIELSIGPDTVAVRTERCSDGQNCDVELPPPTLGTLLADSSHGAVIESGESAIPSARLGSVR
jgi:hypothetical protein